MNGTTLNAAIIGVGAPTLTWAKGGGHQIGYAHASAYLAHPDVKLAAAADISEPHLDAFQAARGPVAGYRDYRTMLREERPDLVSICTYVGLHREMLEAAMEAGVRGILCEKPFVNSPADLAAIRAMVAETGTKIVVAHIRRFRPAFVEASRLLAEGAIGEPVVGVVSLAGWDLSEMGSHHFDLLRMLNGDREVVSVFGQGRVRETVGYGHAMEDHALAWFEFENGFRGAIEAGRSMNGPQFVIAGTRGTLTIEGETVIELVNPQGHRRIDLTEESARVDLWYELVGSLVQWVQGGPVPPSGFESAAKTAEVNLAAYLSMLEGDRIDLPIGNDVSEWPVDLLARRNGLFVGAH